MRDFLINNGTDHCPNDIIDQIKSQNITIIIGFQVACLFTIYNLIKIGDAYFPPMASSLLFLLAFISTKNHQFTTARILTYFALFIPTIILGAYFRTDTGLRSWMVTYILATPLTASLFFNYKEKYLAMGVWVISLIGLLTSPLFDQLAIKKIELELLNNPTFVQFNMLVGIGTLLASLRYSERIKNKSLQENHQLFSSMEQQNIELENQRITLKKQQKENEIFRVEEEKRQWQTEGINIFSSLLRGGHFGEIKDQLIKALVDYLQLNQAAIFVTGEQTGETVLNMEACYAYGRNKHQRLSVNIGDGLVGQCYMEKDEIFLLEVPEGYTKITSGLGEATPRCLCLAPLKIGDKVIGVIETAGFKALEDHQRAFLKNLCEILASAIEQEKVNQDTKKLLEASQKQAKQLATQEEEMRQNIEELSSTQEQFERERKMLLEKIEELQKQKPLVESH